MRTHQIDYVGDHWLPAARATLKPSTAELYATIIDAYIAPRIGDVRLQELAPGHLNRMYAELLAGGRRNGKSLSPKAVRNVHGVIHRALRDAMRWDLVVRNVADAADPPRVPHREISAWSGESLRRFLAATADDRLLALWVFVATTGVRRGEALALRWSDVDLDAARASIARSLAWVGSEATFTEPKTTRSRRVVPLAPETVAAVREHRRRQLEERLAAGPHYDDQGLVFAAEDGAPLSPKNVTKAFGRAVERSGLPRLTLHGLRHTWATLALGAGIPAKVASEMLRHSSTAITLDTYSHVSEGMTRDAADTVGALIFGNG